MEGIKVLLVDDEPELLETLGARLVSRGFATDTAVSGDEALARLQSHDYDVVILDVFMPGKDGNLTLKEIKIVKPVVEVIMLSGQATLDSAIQGMQNGAFDFLVKPADMGDLVDKINKAYSRKAEHEERIRMAGFVKDTVVSPNGQSKSPLSATREPISDEWSAASGRILVIGRESEFSRELIQYALDISKRMSYAIMAMNTAGFDNESFKLFPKARERVCLDFREISEKNAALFRLAARKEGIPFAHVVKFCDRDEAIDEAIHEVGFIDYVVSEFEEGPSKGQIFAYCPT